MRNIFISLLLLLGFFTQAQDYYVSYTQANPPDVGSPIPVIESFSSYIEDANSTDLPLPKPTGLTVGDLMVAIVANDVNDPVADEWSASSDPSGWNFVRSEFGITSDSGIGLFWKIADAGDVAASDFTFSAVGAFDRVGVMLRISGHDPTTPMGIQGTYNDEFGGEEGIPSITTTADNSLAIGVVVGDGRDTSPWSIGTGGMTSVADITTTPLDNDGSSMFILEKDMPTAGATGIQFVTPTGDDGIGIFMFSINSICSPDANELYVDANAASDQNCNETNATTGWSKLGSGALTSESRTLTNGAGNYQLQFPSVSESGGERVTYTFTAVSGNSYRFRGTAQVVSGTAVSAGWKNWTGLTGFTSQTVTTTETQLDITLVANSTTVEVLIYTGTGVGTVIAWDNLSITDLGVL